MSAPEVDVNSVLDRIARTLDISDDQFEQARESYAAVAQWLEREESSFFGSAVDVYPQGSFRLGTVVRPINDSDEFDIDIVMSADIGKNRRSQRSFKEAAGRELSAYARQHSMKRPREKRRCWELEYSGKTQFHMDVLPGIPDSESFRKFLRERGVRDEWLDTAIAITDSELPTYHQIDGDWPISNPVGYAAWFHARMKTRFDAERARLAVLEKRSAEEIEEFRIKTPLQRAIQILKRHRDIMFVDDKDDRPISIIITTLAAHAFGNEVRLDKALLSIVEGMPAYIRPRGGMSWVANPVNPEENFADKWAEHPIREEKFRKWLDVVKADVIAAIQCGDLASLREHLGPRLGAGVVTKALGASPSERVPGTTSPGRGAGRSKSFFNEPHKAPPPWVVNAVYSVKVKGQYSKGGGWANFDSDDAPLPKHVDLLFTATTTVPPPYSVYWQVVNTGREAEKEGQRALRGGIVRASGSGSERLRQEESTLYAGSHWIECFIVVNGRCVGRSGEFVVNIQ